MVKSLIEHLVAGGTLSFVASIFCLTTMTGRVVSGATTMLSELHFGSVISTIVKCLVARWASRHDDIAM